MSEKPVLSVDCESVNPVHVRLRVFNRGGLAGTLCVNTADALGIAGQIGMTASALRALREQIVAAGGRRRGDRQAR